MEAIKKKMQAMKVEKDNACDRVDVCEEQCKAARVINYFDCKEKNSRNDFFDFFSADPSQQGGGRGG